MKRKIRVYAKVNLFLRIRRRRPDGFHEIVTVMHPIELHDDLEVQATDDGFALECDSPDAPQGEENSVFRAWALMRSVAPGKVGGCRVVLRKTIPAKAGLGGASADGAGALLALNRLFEAGLDREALRAIAARLGSDVPFFLGDGPATAEGRGERLRPIKGGLRGPLALALAEEGVSTAEAYGRFTPDPSEEGREAGTMEEAVSAGDVRLTAGSLFNTFERLVFPIRPDLARLKQAALDAGATGALMTGSGSTVFALGLREGAAPPSRGAQWVQSAFHASPHEWLR